MEDAERERGASAHPDGAPADGVAQGEDTAPAGRSATNPSGVPRNGSTAPGQGRSTMARGYARGRQRDERIRAELEPLQPGERPGAVTVAAIAAAILGVLNVVLYAAGVRAAGGTFAGTVGVGAVMLVAAVGMWQARYWAVLGFEALLGITAVYAGLSLLVASSVTGAIRSLLVMAAAGTLFYKLIRAMARIQMPSREPHR